MSGFQEFPKMMVHPAHTPAVLSTIFPLGYKPQPGEVENPGQPERFPSVTVNDANQQEMYEARGYVAQNDGGAQAFDEAKSGKPAAYKYQEYPKWVKIHDDEVLVKSEAEEHALLGYNKPKATEPVSAVAKKKPGPAKGTPRAPRKPQTDRMAVGE